MGPFASHGRPTEAEKSKIMHHMRFKTLLVAGIVLLAGCPSPYELGFPGPYPVKGYHSSFDDDLPITVFHPDTDPPMQHLPVIIFNTGFIQPRASYEGFARQLAQWGFVAVIRAYPSLGFAGVGDALLGEHVVQSQALIDWLAKENLRPESPLFGMVDANTVGTTGHSLGATIAIVTGVVDPRVKAVVSLDVSHNGGDFDIIDELPDVSAAYMYIVGDSGGWCAVAPTAREPLIDYTSPPAIQVIIAGADHMDFMDTPTGVNYLGYVACPRGPLPDQEARNIATKYMVAWFGVFLKGDKEFADYYNGARADADEKAGIVRFIRKLEPVPNPSQE